MLTDGVQPCGTEGLPGTPPLGYHIPTNLAFGRAHMLTPQCTVDEFRGVASGPAAHLGPLPSPAFCQGHAPQFLCLLCCRLGFWLGPLRMWLVNILVPFSSIQDSGKPQWLIAAFPRADSLPASVMGLLHLAHWHSCPQPAPGLSLTRSCPLGRALGLLPHPCCRLAPWGLSSCILLPPALCPSPPGRPSKAGWKPP